MPKAADPLRECISNFWSGLKGFKKALRHRHNSKIRKSTWKLGLSCLLIHVVASLLAFILPRSLKSTSSQLFYPVILLYRYIWPGPWDQLFIDTIRSLGYSERADIVAKPSPDYLLQLKGYCRRTFKAYLGVFVIQYLVNRSGIFKWPSNGLALLAIDHVLRYNGIKRTFWKLIILSFFIAPRWPVWIIQTLVLQQLLVYELLQPYFARVNFKRWEEHAWFTQYEYQLRGFAFGAWLPCCVPWIGAGVIPFLFPAMAVFLTRSCGELENSVHGPQGDVIERQSPGVKLVAYGKSKATGGTWENTTVKTFIRHPNLKVTKPKEHFTENEEMYTLDTGLERAVTEEQLQTDREGLQQRRTEIYDRIRQNWQLQSLFGHPQSYRGPAVSLSDRIQPRTSALQQQDWTNYDFSDRKPLKSTPSAPPAPSDDATFNSDDDFDQKSVFRELSETGMEYGGQQASLSAKYDSKGTAKRVESHDAEQIQADNSVSHQADSNMPVAVKIPDPKTMERSVMVNKANEDSNQGEEDLDEISAEDDYIEDEEDEDLVEPPHDRSDSTKVKPGELRERYRFSANKKERGRKRGGGGGGGGGGRGPRGGGGGGRGFSSVGRGQFRGRIGRGGRNRDSEREVEEARGLAEIISRGFQDIEDQVGQQLDGWGKRIVQRFTSSSDRK
ncbi:hypothetical protein BGZ49_001169 [Haplosporangium sp. Z 27]|nr:hypothetical protein BGZ49_001169 [Haplosporangium sp. Z 27]